jgi:hypothetical protein
MKKMRWLLIVGAGIALLTGCGKNTGEEGSEALSVLEEQANLEAEIAQMEAKLTEGEFTAEDYYTLADLYEQAGYYRKERDLLERCYLLYGDEKSLELLDQITVNLVEESVELNTMVSEIAGYVDTGENYDIVMNTIKDESWMSSLMPTLRVGSRKYFRKLSDSTTAYIEAGYNGGKAYAQIWVMDGTNIRAVNWQDHVYQVLSGGYENAQYQGDFTLWTINESSKEVIWETGTMKNGMLTGSYTAKIGSIGTAAAADFWLTKEEASYTVYSGTFDESGVPTVAQPTEQAQSEFLEDTGYTSFLVYAYSEDQENCLWIGDTSAMTAEQLQLPSVPTFRTYEAKALSSSEQSLLENLPAAGEIQSEEGAEEKAEEETAVSHSRNVASVDFKTETESTDDSSSTTKKQDTAAEEEGDGNTSASSGTTNKNNSSKQEQTPDSTDKTTTTPPTDKTTTTPSTDTTTPTPSTDTTTTTPPTDSTDTTTTTPPTDSTDTTTTTPTPTPDTSGDGEMETPNEWGAIIP